MSTTYRPAAQPPVQPPDAASAEGKTGVRRRGVDARLALQVVALGALTVATWPLLVAPPAPATPGIFGVPLVPAIAHVAGMLAGYGVLVLLVLMSRSPALERGVGADVLTRWHSRLGRAVVVLVLVHACAAVQGWAQSRGLNLLTATWQVLRLPALPAATVGTILMLVAAGVSVRAARSRVRHERWHGLHLLMYVAVALGFGHQLAGPDLVGHRWLQIAWALAYTSVFALVLRHRVLTPLRQVARHRMRVVAVQPEGPGAVSIVIEGEHLDELDAESGQFFRWRFMTPDHWLNAHPFSLSAAPTPTHLRLTVQALGDGSNGLQALPVGTWVIAEGPYGAVTSARRTRPHVLLVAGGVGITPMRALFETMPLAPGEDLLLIYRARSTADLLFRDEIDVIAARREARVLYLVGSQGEALTPAGLQRLVPDVAERDVYLCGSPRLTATVRASLRQLGLPPTQLHEERFAF
jgi:predicted ferric reductase